MSPNSMKDIRVYVVEAAIFLVLMVGILAFPVFDDLDIWLQYFFFDAGTASWMLPPADRGWEFLVFYRAPKILYPILAVIAVIWLYRHWRQFGWDRSARRLTLMLLVAASVPLTIGWLKGTTGVSCPDQETLFGGAGAHASVWQNMMPGATFYSHFHCWPAGHASGGFGLMALRLLPTKAWEGWAWVMPGMAMGWVTGLYQMVRGQHFLSHTVITMLFALFVTSLALAFSKYYWKD